jgi:hypothetical protein
VRIWTSLCQEKPRPTWDLQHPVSSLHPNPTNSVSPSPIPHPHLHFLIPTGSNPTGERTRKKLEDADPSAPRFWKQRPRLHDARGSLNCSKASNHHMIHQKMDITSKPWLPIVTKLKRICRQGVSQIRSGTIQGSAAATRHPFSSPGKESAQDAIEMFRLFTLYSYSDTPCG